MGSLPPLADFTPTDRYSHHSFASTSFPYLPKQINQTNNSLDSLTLEESLDLLDHSKDPVSVKDLIFILQKCRKKGSILYAKRVHHYIREKGMETHKDIGNYLVPMYVECKSISDAEEVFGRLPYRNHYSWTSLIHGYVESGECQHAFDVFNNMQLDMVCPSRHTFLAMLKACIRSKCIDNGYVVHAHIIVEGFEEDLFVGSNLVDMYSKCGRVHEARDVFDHLPTQNTVSWTSIIVGYVDNGCGEEALKCMDQMKAQGVLPDAVTYLCGLKACCSLGFLEKGYALHAEIVEEELDNYPFIGSMLVDMYVKCGLLFEARAVFDDLEVKDVVLWSTLVSGYVESGLGNEALDCIEQMHKANMPLNAYTFNSGLKACCITTGTLAKGRELHDEIVRESYEKDAFVGCALVDMYAKYGSITEAFDVFDELAVRDTVSWTALISGFVEHGFNEEALECLQQMAEEDICPDAATYVCCLKACANLGNVQMGWKLHADIAMDSMENGGIVGSALVDMYAKTYMLEEAQEVFDGLQVRNVVTWTALIAGYLDHGLSREALSLYKRIQMDGILPDAISFAFGLKASASLKHWAEGQGIHIEVVKLGLEKDALVGSSLVDLYAKCGLFHEAKESFDQLLVRDVISWTALMIGYAEQRLEDKVFECFTQMQLDGVSPDLYSWNTVISGCAEQGEKESVFTTYQQMQDQGLLPNSITLVSLLKLCASTTSLEMGKRIHAQIEGATRVENVKVVLANVLIEMYSRCGRIGDALKVFESMTTKDVVTWNTLITGCGRQGEIDIAFSMLERMKEEGIKPESITFVSVLSLCSHVGLVDEGLRYFKAMSKDYGISPDLEHYNCIVDLLGRAGRLNDLFEILESNSFEPDIVTWSTVLSSCHQWGDIELGSRAFEHIARLDKRNAPSLIVMSNMYVDGHMWKSNKIFNPMKGHEMNWIEIDGNCKQSSGEEDKKECTMSPNAIKVGLFDNDTILCQNTESPSSQFELESAPKQSSIRLIKNSKLSIECHEASSQVSSLKERVIICKDSNCFPFVMNGTCSPGD